MQVGLGVRYLLITTWLCSKSPPKSTARYRYTYMVNNKYLLLDYTLLHLDRLFANSSKSFNAQAEPAN